MNIIYAFKSCGKYKTNISEQVINDLELGTNWTKLVMDTEYNKDQFTEPIINNKPKYIIGLGQCGKGEIMKIERQCFNKQIEKVNNKYIFPPIEKSLSTKHKYFTNLPFLHDECVKESNKPGFFVCNYSMFTILQQIPKITYYGFIHIPANFSKMKAISYLNKVIDQIN